MAGLRAFYTRGDLETHYKLGEVLGTGSFAVVKRAVCKKDGTQWAVKEIDKTKLQKEDEEALKVEVAILERMDHPNIVKLRQVFDTPRKVYMVMELMTGGELFDRIVAKEKYSELEAANTISKIASALAYCHERGIVHRDLKPENLLYASGDDEADIKIADFGLAKLISQSELTKTACGTPGYVAPEVLTEVGYGDKVDCWSVGVILYIMLCGFPPFYDESNAALFEQIKSGSYDFPSPYWDEVSAQAKDLVSKLLVVDPTKRLSMKDLLSHPWITHEASSSGGKALNIGEQLRKYNARRRFREGVRKVQALRFFAKLGMAVHAAASDGDASATSSASTAAASGGSGAVGGAGATAASSAPTVAEPSSSPARSAVEAPMSPSTAAVKVAGEGAGVGPSVGATTTASPSTPGGGVQAASSAVDGEDLSVDLAAVALSAIGRVRRNMTMAAPVPIPGSPSSSSLLGGGAVASPVGGSSGTTTAR